MDLSHIQIADALNLRPEQVASAISLLEAGGTVPFIARYRKESTGSLDEVAVASIRDRFERLRELDARRKTILHSLAEQDVLSDTLRATVKAATTLRALEDVYLPFRPKRRTRAAIARERGLQPLADRLMAQEDQLDPAAEAAQYVNTERNIMTADAALAGARDIIAESINEDPQARAQVRALYRTHGVLRAQLTHGQGARGP